MQGSYDLTSISASNSISLSCLPFSAYWTHGFGGRYQWYAKGVAFFAFPKCVVWIFHLLGAAGFEPTLMGFAGWHPHASISRMLSKYEGSVYLVNGGNPSGRSPIHIPTCFGAHAATRLPLYSHCSLGDLNPTFPDRKSGMIGLSTLKEHAGALPGYATSAPSDDWSGWAFLVRFERHLLS